MYYIVEFTEGTKKFVEIVPKIWYSDESISWPTSKNVKQLIKNSSKPETGWKKYPARILNAYGNQTNKFK